MILAIVIVFAHRCVAITSDAACPINSLWPSGAIYSQVDHQK